VRRAIDHEVAAQDGEMMSDGMRVPGPQMSCALSGPPSPGDDT